MAVNLTVPYKLWYYLAVVELHFMPNFFILGDFYNSVKSFYVKLLVTASYMYTFLTLFSIKSAIYSYNTSQLK